MNLGHEFTYTKHNSVLHRRHTMVHDGSEQSTTRQKPFMTPHECGLIVKVWCAVLPPMQAPVHRCYILFHSFRILRDPTGSSQSEHSLFDISVNDAKLFVKSVSRFRSNYPYSTQVLTKFLPSSKNAFQFSRDNPGSVFYPVQRSHIGASGNYRGRIHL